MEKSECFYKVNTFYSITINPENHYQFFSKIDRKHLVKKFFYDVLRKHLQTLHNIKYKLYVEVSEPRDILKYGYDGPRVHFHGTVFFSNRADIEYFLLFQIRALCKHASCEIDTIKDLGIWLQYCKKQDLLRMHPIVI